MDGTEHRNRNFIPWCTSKLKLKPVLSLFRFNPHLALAHHWPHLLIMDKNIWEKWCESNDTKIITSNSHKSALKTK